MQNFIDHIILRSNTWRITRFKNQKTEHCVLTTGIAETLYVKQTRTI